MITDKSLAWAFMAGKSIFGWTCLALSPWASCNVMWLFSPKGSGIFWAKAFRRKTNLSGGRASNHAQPLAPWREGGYQGLLGTMASLPRVGTERSASLAHLRAAGRPGRHSWNAIAYLLALPELKWGYLHQLLWKEQAAESSEKSKEWPAGVLAFLDALRQQHPERGSHAYVNESTFISI